MFLWRKFKKTAWWKKFVRDGIISKLLYIFWQILELLPLFWVLHWRQAATAKEFYHRKRQAIIANGQREDYNTIPRS